MLLLLLLLLLDAVDVDAAARLRSQTIFSCVWFVQAFGVVALCYCYCKPPVVG